jgi:catechol 2,3-dioxygenase-like lactoylglutathione lyase family enzyme
LLHHIDVHVRSLAAVSWLFDGLAEHIGYRRRHDEEPDFTGYETADGGRPRFGLISDPHASAGSMRLAFAVDTHARVDAAARVARERGARAIEGPQLNPEYGDDYYAMFFEDIDGNKYEVLAATTKS